MWISNNSSVAMMMFPITIEIVRYLIKIDDSFKKANDSSINALIVEVEVEVTKPESEINYDNNRSNDLISQSNDLSLEPLEDSDSEINTEGLNLIKGFCLSVAFSATIGGSGSLIGSPPNILLKGFLDEKYPNNNGFNFLTYILYSLPFTIVMLLSAWLLLCFLWIPKRLWFNKSKKSENFKSTALKSIIEKKI